MVDKTLADQVKITEDYSDKLHALEASGVNIDPKLDAIWNKLTIWLQVKNNRIAKTLI